MLTWLRELLLNLCSWLLGLARNVIQWLLDCFSDAFSWILQKLLLLFDRIGLSDLYDYTSDFLSSILSSGYISDFRNYLNHILPWVPWDFLGWCVTFVLTVYINVLFFKLIRKAIRL